MKFFAKLSISIKKIFILISMIVFLVLCGLNRNFFLIKTQQFLLGWDNLFYSSKSNLKHTTFYSSSLKEKRKVAIYLPSNFSKIKTQKLPLLILLHGNPGDENDWIFSGDIQLLLDNLIASGTIPPMIVAMPDGNGSIIKTSQFLNADLVNQSMENYVMDTLDYLKKSYQIDESKILIGGNSSGAYAALNIGLDFRNKFVGIISLSGYSSPKEENGEELLSSQQLEKNQILQKIISAPSNEIPNIFLYCGTNDFFNFEKINRDMYKALSDKGVNTKLLIDNGGHDWFSWNKALGVGLSWMNSSL